MKRKLKTKPEDGIDSYEKWIARRKLYTVSEPYPWEAFLNGYHAGLRAAKRKGRAK